jgi:hypothetical protein
MVGSGRLIGLVLIVVAVAILLVAGVWITSTLGPSGPGRIQGGGAAVAMIFALIPALVIGGAGVWFLMHGRTEVAQFADVEKQKRILNIVQTQGTVQLASMALEMNMPLSQVKEAIYDLVGKGLFTGYVDWKSGKLVSSDAAAINDAVVTGKCPNCGAPQVVAGKGMIRCEYCGAEFFLPKA